MIEIIPTCVPKNLDDLAKTGETIRAYAPAIHVDVTDGLFAPHTTWPYTAVGTPGPVNLTSLHDLFIEVHLMTEEPRELGEQFAHSGAKRIIGHLEAFPSPEVAHAALSAWKEAGAREVGLGILFGTDLSLLDPLVALCDVVHLMSINAIGTQGIPYEPTAPARIAQFHQKYPGTLISVDGGVAESNIAALVSAGARRFGVGSAISKALDQKAAYETLKNLAEHAVQ